MAKEDHMQIDPQLLFVATNEFTEFQDLFKDDLCSKNEFKLEQMS